MSGLTLVNDSRVGLRGMYRLEGAAGVKTMADMKTLAGAAADYTEIRFDEIIFQMVGGEAKWTDNGSTPSATDGSGMQLDDGVYFKYPGDDYAALKFYLPASSYLMIWLGNMSGLKTG